MHLGRSNLIHSHRGPLSENRHDSKRFACSRMLYVARLCLAEEVIRHAMSQQACKFLLRDTGLFGKLLKGASSLEGDKVLDVVFENGLQADRCGKLFGLAYYLAMIKSLTDLATIV
jgi:hypothetical protein